MHFHVYGGEEKGRNTRALSLVSPRQVGRGTGHCNTRWVFPINTCGRHRSRIQNNHEPPTYLGLCLIRCCAAKTSSSYSSTCISDRESKSPKPSPLVIVCTGRWRIRFLESNLSDCSLVTSSYSPRLIYLFIGHVPRVIAFNTNFVRMIAVFIRSSSSRNRMSHTVPAFKSCLTYLIC
jgi:hypothetical protein